MCMLYAVRVFTCIVLNFRVHSVYLQQKRRERGRIDVRGIKLVEPAILHGEGGDVHAPNVSCTAINLFIHTIF